MPDPDHVPTMFEWAGGFPALQRMTRLFYEKHVPQDPMLAPLFANMSADHPQRVAKWLGEVFGGPKLYSDEYGGYPPDSMKFAFDLWSYEDVRAHADAILERLHNGSMPCDGAWPAEHVDVFERWITAGMDA